MTNDEITKTLMFIRPKAKWVLTGDDFNNIEWLDEIQTKPTILELENGFAEYNALKQERRIEAERAKAALLEKLGITEEEAKLLLS
jgi:hypothetical protein